jgi:hypothetical protein
MTRLMQRRRPSRNSQPDAPWRTDVDEVRREAVGAAKPCVIILNADSSAL